MNQNIIDRLNHLADEKEPFLFVINYDGMEAYIRKLSEISPEECLYDFEGITNVKRQLRSASAKPQMWTVHEPDFVEYKKVLRLSRATFCVVTVSLLTLPVRWLWIATFHLMIFFKGKRQVQDSREDR